MSLDNVRKQENIDMAKNIKSVYDIIGKKCLRCKAQSCMGCVFGPGEMMHDIYHIIELLSIQDFEACLEGFNMDQTQFDAFIEKFRKIYDTSGQ